MAITPFKVIQGHRFRYHSKARIRTSYIFTSVFELSLNISQIIAFQRRLPLFNTLVRALKLTTTKFGIDCETFRHIEPFRITSMADNGRTDGRTEWPLAIAV